MVNTARVLAGVRMAAVCLAGLVWACAVAQSQVDQNLPEAKSTDGNPPDNKSSDSKPPENKTTDGKPTDGKPAEVKPAEVKPTDSKPADAKSADVPSLPDVLKEGTLELKARLYLPDGKGDPRFVPNMRLGELLDMVRSQALRSEGADLPTYKFDELVVSARVMSEVADVTARATVTLSENALPVTAVGLRLQSLQLSKPITFSGNGKHQWQIGKTDPGYTWWLSADPNTTHTATLVGQSVLITEGDRQSLPLSLPATTTSVELFLQASCQDVRVRGQGGELLRIETSDGEQKVSVRCNGGDINVSWRNGSDGKPVAGAAEATSKTRFKIDDPREIWEAETEFTLRAYGESPVDSLTIDLPEGAQWVPSPTTSSEQFTVVEEPPVAVPVAPAPVGLPPSDAAPNASTPVATAPSVSGLAKAEAIPGDQPSKEPKTASPDTIKPPRPRIRLSIRAQSRAGLAALETIAIRWRWTPATDQRESAMTNIAVPAIAVLAVDRHEGTMTFVLPAAYGLDWKSQPGTELVQQSRITDTQEQLQYVFRFARQPSGLVISFRREVNVAEVRPTYLAEVDRGKVKLTGWLQCAFDRSQHPELALALGDWALDSAQVISDMSTPYAEGELLSQQALPGGLVRLSNDLDAELNGSGRRQRQLWRVVAYRSLTEGSIEHLKLTVPAIVLLAPDSSRIPIDHAAGVLLMAASENVLMSWDERSSQSLLADAVSSEWTALLPQQMAERAMAYRFQSGADKAPVWSGRVEILPRRIAAEQVAVVKLDIDAARITQRFTLQIANEPLQRLQLIANGTLDGSVLVNGVPCVLEAGAPLSESSAGNNQTVWTVVGAPKLFGKVDVEVRSQMALPVPKIDSTVTQVELSLVKLDLPDALLANRAQVTITADRRLSVSLSSNALAEQGGSGKVSDPPNVWSPLPSAPIDIPAGDTPLQLRVRLLDEVDPLPVRVAGAWLQTAINGSTRLDRFCARFETEQDQIAVLLPTFDLLSAQVAIDGVQLNTVVDTSQGRLQLDLRGLKPTGKHTLEVWTRSAATLGWLNPIDVVPVTVEGCRQYDHFYWQLVAPANQHLVRIPDSVTAEWRWVWDRLWWHRLSPQDQPFFEQWLAASEQPPLAESANRYVVSSYGPVASFRCWTASRLLLWLPVGLMAIGCALAVSLWRPLRHPIFVILLAAVISMLAAAWPDLAILIGQTTVLALLIVMLYALTQAAIESRVRRRSIFTTRPTSAMSEPNEIPSLMRGGSHGSSEIMATTRTQMPIISDGGLP